MSNGRETSELNLLSVKLKRSLGELESLLDKSLELSDSSSLVTENFLGVGSSDDDLSSGVGDSDLTSRVSLLGELSGAGVSGILVKRAASIPSGIVHSRDDTDRGCKAEWAFLAIDVCGFRRIVYPPPLAPEHSQELSKLSLENTVGDELSLF